MHGGCGLMPERVRAQPGHPAWFSLVAGFTFSRSQAILVQAVFAGVKR
jgi:hypothetical protein